MMWPVLVLLCVLSPSPRALLQDADAPEAVAQIVEAWRAMSPEEREQVQENFARWRQLDDPARQRMKTRHRSLQDWRKRVEGVLEEEQATDSRPRSPRERQTELQRRTRETLERYSRSLPDAARQKLRRELKDVPPEDRARRTADWIREEIARRFPSAVERLVERGVMNEAQGTALQRRFEESGAAGRQQILRRILQSHPRELEVPAEVLEAVARPEQVEDRSAPVRWIDGLRGPRFPREVVLLHLQRRGVPQSEIDRLARVRGGDFENAVERICRRNEIPSPGQLSRRLRARGVNAERLRHLFQESSPDQALDRLEEWESR